MDLVSGRRKQPSRDPATAVRTRPAAFVRDTDPPGQDGKRATLSFKTGSYGWKRVPPRNGPAGANPIADPSRVEGRTGTERSPSSRRRARGGRR